MNVVPNAYPMQGTAPYFQGYPPTGYPYPPTGYPMYPQMGVPPVYPYGMYQIPPGMPPIHYPVQVPYSAQGPHPHPVQNQYGVNFSHQVPPPYMNMNSHPQMLPK
jgi:hypothetical protein